MTIPLDKLVREENSNKHIIGFDPGETTGFARFDGLDCSEAKQIPTGSLNKDTFELVKHEILFKSLDCVVIEDYFVYFQKKKLEAHRGNYLHTPKLIGMILSICMEYNIEYKLQIAAQGKTMKDDHLKLWSLWNKNQRHANDAIRHCLFYLIHNKQEETSLS